MERRERFVVMSMSASQRLSRFEIPLRPERHLDRSKCSYLVRSGLMTNSSNPTVWEAKTGPRSQNCCLGETTGVLSRNHRVECPGVIGRSTSDGPKVSFRANFCPLNASTAVFVYMLSSEMK